MLNCLKCVCAVTALMLLSAHAQLAVAASAPAGKEQLQAEILRQSQAARKILDGWQSVGPVRAERKLHVVYWTPGDREPVPQHRERLSAILKDIQSFYAREMERLGFGPRTIHFDFTADGLINVHLVHGAMPYASYSRESGKQIREECVPVLRQAGIQPERETLVIFCNMSNWDATNRKMTQNSPYYARGTILEGTAWQVDSPLLDLTLLTEKNAMIDDGQYRRISVGRYNSIFIGGIAHEIGHALSLPHCKECPEEHAAFGTSLMGAGNRTYGKELRGEGAGSFLTLAEGMRLAGHPMFSGSMKGATLPPSVTPTNLKIEPHGKGFRFSGSVQAEPPVYGMVAYLDPAGGQDYDAMTATSVPDADGRFMLDCQGIQAGKPATLRITYLQANGVPSGALSETPFRYPYSVSSDGQVDISAARAQIILEPLIKAINQGQVETARELMSGSGISSDPVLKPVAERIVNSSTPRLIEPSTVARGTNSVALSDLKAVLEKVGYGRPVRDRLPGTRGAMISGSTLFQHGFYAHADSEYAWQLDGTWNSLSGAVGMADGNDGTVIASVEGDGKVLWKSSTITAGPVVKFQVNITGVKRLALKISDAGDGRGGDWGLWLEPTLTR